MDAYAIRVRRVLRMERREEMGLEVRIEFSEADGSDGGSRGFLHAAGAMRPRTSAPCAAPQASHSSPLNASFAAEM